MELITRSVETEVQRAWSRGEFRPAGEPIAATTQSKLLPVPDERVGQPIDLAAEERDSAFDFLLGESERAELKQDWERAFAELAEARTRTDDPRRLVLADLRAVQIAAQTENTSQLASALERLLKSAQGDETLGGVSVVLTALTTSLPLRKLDDEALHAALDQLEAAATQALLRGELALPRLRGLLSETEQGIALRLDPIRALYLAPLIEHGGEALAHAARTRLEHDPYAWISQRFGALQFRREAEIRRTTSFELGTGIGVGELFLAPEAAAAWVLEEDDLRAQLGAWLQQEAGVPEEVEIRLIRNDEQPPFPELLPRGLTQTPYGVVAWFRDPAGYQQSIGAGYRWLRITLHALGVMSVLLGLALHRQRLRERAVQQLKSEFVANVSHELRTPLSSILLMAENLRAGKISAEAQQRYHELILRESQRLRRLVDDVLDFSRLDRGQGPRARMEPVELGDFAEDLHADLGAWAAQHGMQLDWQTEGWSGEAELDREAVRRALFNFVDNARRHARARRLWLHLESDADRLRLSCRDDGPGLPAGSETRVFQPFEQLESRSTDGKGAGLGLAIVAEIARAHGGRASAHNHPEGGAVFQLELPRRSAS
ncbi:MAG: hypothetical protein CMJ94_08630 [Planctomycetes bacterium]|nr:hypothetical protein [Planctomycetota bacterium]